MWSASSMSAAAGALIAVLDEYLLDNSNWTLEEEVATNHKVYKNAGLNSLFYFDVDDTVAAYAAVRISAGWDTGTHAPTGETSAVNYINKSTGDWGMAYNDTRLVWCNCELGQSYYIGQTKRCVSTLNYPIIVAAILNNYTTYNSLALYHAYTGATSLYWRMLKIGSSVVRSIYPWTEGITSRHILTPTGAAFWESPIYAAVDLRMVGWLDGVHSGGSVTVFNNRDKITVAGLDWIVLRASTAGLTLVRMS